MPRWAHTHCPGAGLSLSGVLCFPLRTYQALHAGVSSAMLLQFCTHLRDCPVDWSCCHVAAYGQKLHELVNQSHSFTGAVGLAISLIGSKAGYIVESA